MRATVNRQKVKKGRLAIENRNVLSVARITRTCENMINGEEKRAGLLNEVNINAV